MKLIDIFENGPQKPKRKPLSDLDLEQVHQLAEINNVELDVHPVKDHWHLQWINRNKISNAGSGKLVLDALHALADKRKKIITLQVYNNKDYLHNMYKNYGYTYSPKKIKDVQRYGPWMIRQPK